jgi:protein-S-isoprenylcysteine O-methyltransferase Ste14
MAANPSPVSGLILIASTVGAVIDFRYVRAGGKRSARIEKILFWAIALVLVVAIGATEYLNLDPYGILGYTIVPLVVVLFGAWELGRWRTRRKFPLQKMPAKSQS